ncbi:MAG: hypothetical protein WCQ50_11800 [Spirochaetota bacterium]
MKNKSKVATYFIYFYRSRENQAMAKRGEKRRFVRVAHPSGEEAPIRFELFSIERLKQHAVSLTQAQKVSSHKEVSNKS